MCNRVFEFQHDITYYPRNMAYHLCVVIKVLVIIKLHCLIVSVFVNDTVSNSIEKWQKLQLKAVNMLLYIKWILSVIVSGTR